MTPAHGRFLWVHRCRCRGILDVSRGWPHVVVFAISLDECIDLPKRYTTKERYQHALLGGEWTPPFKNHLDNLLLPKEEKVVGSRCVIILVVGLGGNSDDLWDLLSLLMGSASVGRRRGNATVGRWTAGRMDVRCPGHAGVSIKALCLSGVVKVPSKISLKVAIMRRSTWNLRWSRGSLGM